MMVEFPPWLKEAMQHRFDELAVQAFRDPDLEAIRARFQKSLDQIKAHLGETRKTLFMEWEEENSYLHSAEKERLYLHGVQDGAGMQIALMGNPWKSDSL